MRRLATIITTLALTMSGLIFSSAQANGISEVNCSVSGYFVITDNKVDSNNACVGNVAIPSSVTSIETYAFQNASIDDVTFEAQSALLTINADAFSWSSMSSITLPEGVTSIGISAFQGTQISAIEIPASVTSIGNQAFQYLDSLETVTFHESSNLETIGNYAFQGASSLSSIRIPASVTSIGEGAFDNSNSLTSVTFATPSSLETIGLSAFQFAPLNRITIPASVEVIGNSAFRGTGISRATFAGPRTESLTIGDYAFSNSQNLSSILIPASVTSIGEGAFEYSNSLVSVTFASPSTLESIGEYAFRSTELVVIDIPASVTSIGDGAFHDTYSMTQFSVSGDSTNFKAVDEVLFTHDSSTLVAYPAAKSDVSYEIPNDTTTILDGAFLAAFDLGSFTVEPGGSTVFVAVNGVLFTDDQSTLVAYPAAKSVVSYQIPEIVTAISPYAFTYAQLATITFHPSSDLVTIGKYSFSGASFTTIQIPANVTELGEGVFANSNLLTSVTFATPSSLLTIRSDAFSGSSLATITIPASVTLIGDNAFAGTSLSTNPFTSASALETIGNYAFSNAVKLTSVTIPDSVTSIGEGAFDYATSLASVTFTAQSSLAAIGDYAFAGTRIKTIQIPATVSTIARWALSQAHELNSISFLGQIAGGVIQLEPLERAGFTFNGWYSNSSLTSKITDDYFPYNVDGPATLYTKFTRNNVKASASVKPTISGKATSTKKGTNKLTAKKGTWAGYPTPAISYQWYSCTSQVKNATQSIPKTCKAISKATKSKLAVTTSLKGKYIAVAVTGKGSGTTATRWLSKSTAKVK
jgi:uncharacterized repeat protein (TIGR02543 family)